MGYEYKLFACDLNADEVLNAIRRAPYPAEFDKANDLFHLRDPEDDSVESGWPSLIVKVESDGIYLWHCGNKKAFGIVVDYLNEEFPNRLSLEEL